jgi:hypothetical protein
MATERLDDLEDDEAEDGLARVAAYLTADELQEGAAGLRVTFGVVNEGLERVALLNPFELAQWELLDEAGAPLTVPSSPPSLFVHRPRSAPWRLDSPLRILEVRRDGRAVEPGVLDSPSLEIDPAGECAVTFEIDRVLDDDGTPPLQAGGYAIACVVTLIDAADTERSRILRSRPIRIHFQPRRT